MKEVNRRLLSQQGVPQFDPVRLSLADLVEQGQRLVAEQDAVKGSNLGEQYMRGVAWGDNGKGGWASSDEEAEQ